jgi:hypothetical protein
MNTSSDHSHCVPIQRSIVSAGALALIIAQAYGLGSVGCQEIKSGMVDIYAITAAAGPAILWCTRVRLAASAVVPAPPTEPMRGGRLSV